jgi:hypothetical protein
MSQNLLAKILLDMKIQSEWYIFMKVIKKLIPKNRWWKSFFLKQVASDLYSLDILVYFFFLRTLVWIQFMRQGHDFCKFVCDIFILIWHFNGTKFGLISWYKITIGTQVLPTILDFFHKIQLQWLVLTFFTNCWDVFSRDK